ncbi:SMI1-KNR4 cell-wall [Filimonas lacunae]|uniref:SMI1-KNR4 cell-wall n=1 Tax=Filimonas lacunae TaxID=477680 RepID=A0A173MG90_9BACT|nr:SMI1/KNR4 family protein [Filimonas lacunae]BAV06497.1 hypothetical protein FLA_2516 [Filimonas lacunae]SIT27179.1 SMI1-KNR4 cell-wall [Filimonas lacunae]
MNTMVKRGFALLQTREPGDVPDIHDIEKNAGVKLPPLYKTFITCFKTGEYAIQKEQRITADKKTLLEFTWYNSEHPVFTDNDIRFDFFNNIEYEIEYNQNCLVIGTCHKYYQLLLSIEGEAADQLFLHIDEATPLVPLHMNIFQFVQTLVLIPIEEKYIAGMKYSQLYKKWGNEYWQTEE